MLTFFKWVSIAIVAVVIIWLLIIFLYFKSMTVSSESPISISYKTTASAYASLNVLGYSENYEDIVRDSISDFANRNKMEINYGSKLQMEGISISLTRDDIRIKVVNLDRKDDFLYVFLYKGSDWDNLNEKKYQLLFDSLIREFDGLDLEVADVKFGGK